MDLPTARREVTETLQRMSAAYYRDVFDEWAIVAIGAKHGGVAAYHGVRGADFITAFQSDFALLRAALEGKELGAGDFDFVPDGRGYHHDAAVKIGRRSYLILNNTYKTMAEIRTDPRWVHAQPHFVALTEKFSSDPLEEL